MAKHRPPLDVDSLTENLKQSKGQGMGVFFSPPLPHPGNAGAKPQTAPPRQHTKPEHAKTAPKAVKKNREALNEDPSNDVTTSLLHDVNLREWRDLIEDTETHNSSLRLTRAEMYEVEDVKKELERKLKVGTSLNEMARLGLLYIIHDFKKNREKSLIVKVKTS